MGAVDKFQKAEEQKDRVLLPALENLEVREVLAKHGLSARQTAAGRTEIAVLSRQLERWQVAFALATAGVVLLLWIVLS